MCFTEGVWERYSGSGTHPCQRQGLGDIQGCQFPLNLNPQAIPVLFQRRVHVFVGLFVYMQGGPGPRQGTMVVGGEGAQRVLLSSHLGLLDMPSWDFRLH